MTKSKKDTLQTGERRRPSGAKNKFTSVTKPDGSKEQIPVAKDVGTFIYLANEDGSWPDKPLTTLLVDATWLTEGATCLLEEMRPGKGMGETRAVQVIEHDITISVHGKYAQAKRRVLVVGVIPNAQRSDTFAEEYLKPTRAAHRKSDLETLEEES